MNKRLLLAIMAQKIAASNYMRIATSATGTDTSFFYKSSLVTAAKTTIFEARLKIVSSGTDYCVGMNISNGARYVDLYFKSSSVICNYAGTSPYTHFIDASVLHTYKLKFNGTTNCEFYVDDVLVHTAIYANLPTDPTNGIYFGDYQTGANRGGTSVWQYVKYNIDYVANPTNFVEWTPVSLPSSQGWTSGGNASLATIITE